MTDTEVITTAIASTMFFYGNMEKARSFMSSTGIVKNMLSKSRFCRRVHALSDLIYDMFHQLGSVLKTINISTEYIETVFSVISSYLPKWIHAVTLKGFLPKVCLFVFAYTLDKAFL